MEWAFDTLLSGAMKLNPLYDSGLHGLIILWDWVFLLFSRMSAQVFQDYHFHYTGRIFSSCTLIECETPSLLHAPLLYLEAYLGAWFEWAQVHENSPSVTGTHLSCVQNFKSHRLIIRATGLKHMADCFLNFDLLGQVSTKKMCLIKLYLCPPKSCNQYNLKVFKSLYI